MKNSLLCAIAAAALTAGAALGQAPAAPAFEVASIKVSPLDIMQLGQQIINGGSMPKMGPRIDGARAEYSFMTLKQLIVEAYKVKEFQVTGPDWLSATTAPRYDIQAKIPDGATKEQAPQMLQALLAERFKLAVRRDTKERQVLALVAAKGGPKLQPSTDKGEDVDPNAPLKPGETQIDTGEGMARVTTDRTTGASSIDMGKRGKINIKVSAAEQSIHLESSRVTMSAFADMLSQLTRMTGGSGQQVVDMTGIEGNYVVAIDLSMADILSMARSLGAALPNMPAAAGSPADAASDPGGSSLYKTVQAMGLKLEPRNSSTEQLIVDHVEKTPTEN
jgi:uncharacterized protein (TIGR03435 family)